MSLNSRCVWYRNFKFSYLTLCVDVCLQVYAHTYLILGVRRGFAEGKLGTEDTLENVLCL